MGIGINLRGISSGGKEERWHMRSTRAEPHSEVFNAASEVLSPGKIPEAGGYGLVTVEDGEMSDLYGASSVTWATGLRRSSSAVWL